jgi:stress response protein SCP2
MGLALTYFPEVVIGVVYFRQQRTAAKAIKPPADNRDAEGSGTGVNK